MSVPWRSCGALVATLVAAGCAGEAVIEVSPGEADDAPGGKADGDDGPRAELKVTVEPGQIRRARSRLGLRNDASETRRIWFYDTPRLELLDAGAILRAREIDGDDDDSTVKLRPLDAAAVDPGWLELDGFKCELDRSIERATSSCSLTAAQDDDEIDEVGDGERAIDKLFSEDQEALLAGYGPGLDWEALAPLGPIRARVWTLRTDDLPAKLTAELWYLADGSQVLELSMKVPVDDGDDGLDALLGWLDEVGLDLAADQESKTRRALELYSATGAG
jgi:hypothetical protein